MACDLQAFLVFSQYPAWVYYADKPRENAVYFVSMISVQNCWCEYQDMMFGQLKIWLGILLLVHFAQLV